MAITAEVRKDMRKAARVLETDARGLKDACSIGGLGGYWAPDTELEQEEYQDLRALAKRLRKAARE